MKVDMPLNKETKPTLKKKKTFPHNIYTINTMPLNRSNSI